MDHQLPELASRDELRNLLREWGLMGTAAEIGAAEGRFSREPAQWGFRVIYLVDLWKHVPFDGVSMLNMPQDQHDSNFASVVRLTEEYPGTFQILRERSIDAAAQILDGSLDFVFIDATHEYKEVLADLRAWWPKLRTGGVCAGHDFLNLEYGVNRAAREFAAEHQLSLGVIEPDRIDNASFWTVK